MKFNNRNVFISSVAKIAKTAKIGDNTTIYDNVVIGEHSIISNDCVIGEPLHAYYSDKDYKNPTTIIGANALIRSHTIIYAGCELGESFSTGHRVTIREFSKFGKNCSVGTISDIQGYMKAGDYCRLHSNVHIGQKSTLGNFVFIYPYVVLTNDPLPPSNFCIGPNIGDYTQIAVFSTIMPGVNIGQHCLVGAGSIVTKDVENYQLVYGSPAKYKCDVRQLKDKKTGEIHYPWPLRFDRNMPWKDIGFAKWIDKGNDD